MSETQSDGSTRNARSGSPLPESALIREKFDDDQRGDRAAWHAVYHDDARVYYNRVSDPMTAAEAAQMHADSVERLASYHFDPTSFRVGQWIDDAGATWVSFNAHWIAVFSEPSVRIVVPTAASYRFVDGKIADEYGYWDDSIVGRALAAMRASASATTN